MINNTYYRMCTAPTSCTTSVILNWRKAALSANCQLAYATFGALNSSKDNAILVPTCTPARTRSSSRCLLARGALLMWWTAPAPGIEVS
jgi:hypothetical protein